MNSSPIKIKRKVSPYMKADPSFGGGQVPIDTSDGGSGTGAYDAVNDKRIAGTYDGKDEVFDNVVLGAASVAPFTGEVIDFKNTISDIIKGDYSGAAMNAMGFLIPFVPGSVVKAGGKAMKEWIKKNKDTVVNSFKKNKENTIANQMNAKQVNVKTDVSADDAVKKINANIDMYGQPNPTLYGAPKTRLEFNKVVQESTEGIGAMGRSMDNAGVTIKNLDPKKSVKKIGISDSGQEIYEVTYPNGEKLKFWESTGSANKPVVLSAKNAHLNAKNSKGFFGVFPGNMDASNVGMSKSWYIKSAGWERGYGSEIVEDTGIWLKSLKESGILK